MRSYTNKEWILPKAIPEGGVDGWEHLPTLIQQMLFTRGYLNSESVTTFFDPPQEDLDPYYLSGMPEAVERVQRAIQEKQKIIVYGDFDVDGMTGTALLTKSLSALGADIDAYIPDRFKEGYGLNVDAIRSIATRGVKLLITVDCGIRSPKEVELASELGMDVVLTDHHLPGNDLPQASAVICQKKGDENYPNRHIAGVGLAYKLMCAVFQQFERSLKEMHSYLDLVALGTVADVVPLIGENRSFVRRGLEQIHLGNRAGIRALTLASGISSPALVTSQDIGFRLGPRLNAAGRLETAMLGWELLTTDDEDRAIELAGKLNTINGQRQDKTMEAYEHAMSIAVPDSDHPVIFAIHEEYHEGVVGLVASRLMNTYYRPAIVGREYDGLVRASCRSVDEFNITYALDQCSDLLEQYGGHAMAAGLTVKKENLPELKARLWKLAKEQVQWDTIYPTIKIDGESTLMDLRPNLLDHLKSFEPTGESNPQPLIYSKNLRVRDKRQIGKFGKHLKLKVTDGAVVFDAIAFNMGELIEILDPLIDIVYHYQINDFNGGLQLVVRDIAPGS